MVFLLNAVVMGQKSTVTGCLGGRGGRRKDVWEERRMYSQEMFKYRIPVTAQCCNMNRPTAGY